jgi:hypothetical protein
VDGRALLNKLREEKKCPEGAQQRVTTKIVVCARGHLSSLIY